MRPRASARSPTSKPSSHHAEIALTTTSPLRHDNCPHDNIHLRHPPTINHAAQRVKSPQLATPDHPLRLDASAPCARTTLFARRSPARPPTPTH
jgi:hypothetical protein